MIYNPMELGGDNSIVVETDVGSFSGSTLTVTTSEKIGEVISIVCYFTGSSTYKYQYVMIYGETDGMRSYAALKSSDDASTRPLDSITVSNKTVTAKFTTSINGTFTRQWGVITYKKA